MARFGLTITDEMEQALRAEARRTHRPLAEVVRMALEQYLKQQGHEIKEQLEWGGKRDKDVEQ